MNIGILGTGSIATIMANTITQMKHANITCYTIASRTLPKAQTFANTYNIEKAYGSYEELVQDPNIDLIYIATPHTSHYKNALLCLQNQKPILCEKPFTVNYSQAKQIIELAKKQQVFVAEAIWTRYMPSRKILEDLLASNIIGKVHSLQANIGYHLQHVTRMNNPMLAGGALLDIGVYPIHLAMMLFGNDATLVSSYAHIQHGVDLMDSITMQWPDGKMAVVHVTMMTNTDKNAYIYGEKGYIKIININNPEHIIIYNHQHERIKEVHIPSQISGYEYELYACEKAINTKQIECEEIPHACTLHIMQFMDQIRRQWNLQYPFE